MSKHFLLPFSTPKLWRGGSRLYKGRTETVLSGSWSWCHSPNPRRLQVWDKSSGICGGGVRQTPEPCSRGSCLSIHSPEHVQNRANSGISAPDKAQFGRLSKWPSYSSTGFWQKNVFSWVLDKPDRSLHLLCLVPGTLLLYRSTTRGEKRTAGAKTRLSGF